MYRNFIDILKEKLDNEMLKLINYLLRKTTTKFLAMATYNHILYMKISCLMATYNNNKKMHVCLKPKHFGPTNNLPNVLFPTKFSCNANIMTHVVT